MPSSNLIFNSGLRFSREQYLLNKVFRMPHPSGPKRALAVEQDAEITLVAVYTLLITGAFMAFWILLAMVLPHLLPAAYRQQDAFQTACAWEITEPFQAAIGMGGFCWLRIKSVLSRGVTPATAIANLRDLKDLFFGLLIVLLAIGDVVGGIIAGVYLPGQLVIGNVAPVNPRKLFLWNCFQMGGNGKPRIAEMESRVRHVAAKRLSRAVGVVDSSALELDDKVLTVTTNPTELPTGEQSYDIQYSFSVAEYEMGLQTNMGLVLFVEGQCRFEYDWYNGTQTISTDEGIIMYDRYFPWGDESKPSLVDLNSTCASKDPWYDLRLQRDKVEPASAQALGGEFYLNVLAQGRGTQLPSRDPWYLTGLPLNHGYGGEPWECNFLKNRSAASLGYEGTPRYPYNEMNKYRVKPGRPMLRCNEQMTASFSGFPGRFIVPRVSNNPSTKPFKAADLAQWESVSRQSLGPTGITFPPAVAMVFAVNIALYTPLVFHIGGHSSVLGLIAGDLPHVLDGGSNSAHADIKRVVSAAYIATRNMFRDTALDYSDSMMPPEAIANHTLGLNILVNASTGEPLSGAGEFVLPSDRVTTLSLKLLIGIPAVLGGAWLLVLLLSLCGRSRHAGRCPVCGRHNAPAGI